MGLDEDRSRFNVPPLGIKIKFYESKVKGEEIDGRNVKGFEIVKLNWNREYLLASVFRFRAAYLYFRDTIVAYFKMAFHLLFKEGITKIRS